ncbi:hypothetical protein A3E15_03275 [Candidatus Woesebacteria bacterium RIFCSPHIGHO2_12_FULL_42_9]|uniref:Uncharacterized protein n=2 Tax=Candidatus Woeseibacteriota TaxID=1752722 RepID=A0A1F8AUP0_9BACT|nr:MAG: Tetratricopeptide TPR_1 repeat-containing protein [Candidatus Woesebacteria bacterium GW2011_GWA1_39_12]OGM55441.1 MAG: hypothetical protein A3E15_03275 [Candidatus Woesebacteria bacterium RIFCSPHIGHO2_12_FULL_42_9]
MKFFRSTKYLFIILFISFVLYFPSLFTFYTHDDFFLLKISQAGSLKEFLNFFNLTQGPDGLGMYRPLTTQVFYFLAWKLFNFYPLGLHIISFIVFFAVTYLTYRLTKMLLSNFEPRTTDKIPLIAAFLYATSASHFGHLYYLATFQELGMTLFFILSVLFFIEFLEKSDKKHLVFSIMTFILSLLSKETAVVLPMIFIPIYWLMKKQKKNKLKLGELLTSLIPFLLILAVYLYMRVSYYGFATGDSYLWDFSIRRLFNTFGWYGLWAFNLPEMLVDFVGPGLKFNPNLFKFWSKEIIPIFILFSGAVIILLYKVFRNIKNLFTKRNLLNLFIFCIAWFFVTLLPVLFLPLHKFTFYLTLPLIGIVIIISYLLTAKRQYFVASLFMIIWLILSFMTIGLTKKTHWITRGGYTAKNVHDYLLKNKELVSGVKSVAFYDTQEDRDLPWSPTALLKVVLSDQNYFEVFWKGEISASYSSLEGSQEGGIRLKSRQFLGY